MRYIGIDIGDGESAVALLEEASVIEPVIQPIDGHGSILSVVGMCGTDVAVGERALLDHKVMHLRSRFKSRYLTDPDSERDIERFAFGIRHRLEEETPDLFNEDTYVAVGCPAGWNEEQRARYLSVIKRAGFENAHIVSESRAAFFYARYAHGLNVEPEMLDKSTLVIDIGSSTTDFAYIVNGRESAIGTFGDVSLGGGLIEACMLRKTVNHSENRKQLEDVFAESSSWKNRCEIVARRLKEQYFLDEDRWLSTPCVASETIYYDEPVKLRFELNSDIVRDIISTPMPELHGCTFAESLSDMLRHAKSSTAAQPPELIILTGGASRMGFFKKACADEFPRARVVVCPEPEFSIAKGLAYAARVDKRLEEFNADIQSFFDSGEIEEPIRDSLEWLIVPMTGVLSDHIINDVMLTVLKQWQCGDLRTIQDMSLPIAEGIRRLLADTANMPELEPVIEQWCRRLFMRLQPRIDAICRAHNVDRSSMSLKTVNSVVSPDNISISVNSPMAEGLTYAVTTAVTAALCGGGSTALLMAGPIGLLIGAVIGVILGYIGNKVAGSAIKNGDIPLFLRRHIVGSSVKRALSSPKQRKQIEEELVRAMHKPEFTAQLSADSIASLKKQVVSMAKSVEMPIVQ